MTASLGRYRGFLLSYFLNVLVLQGWTRNFIFLPVTGLKTEVSATKDRFRESQALFDQSLWESGSLGGQLGDLYVSRVFSLCAMNAHMCICLYAYGHVCMYACFSMWVDTSAHAYDHMCMWRPEVEAENHLWSDFYLILWIIISQSNPELRAMATLTSQLALGPFVSAFWCGSSLCVPWIPLVNNETVWPVQGVEVAREN